jgi:hypothetical protein
MFLFLLGLKWRSNLFTPSLFVDIGSGRKVTPTSDLKFHIVRE